MTRVNSRWQNSMPETNISHMKFLTAAAGACLVMSLCAPAVANAQNPPEQNENAIIEGVVRVAGIGTPLRGAQVTAAPNAGDGSLKQVLTDSQGRFSLSVSPGQYRVAARLEGFVSRQLGQRSDASPGTLVRLEARQRLSNAVIDLVPTGTITGRIFDPDGRPKEGVAVSLATRSWTPDGRRAMRPAFETGVRAATTNDLGEYRLYWIPPGDYYLAARGNAALGTIGFAPTYVTTYYPGTDEAAQAAAIKVQPGAELGGISFTMSQIHTTNVMGRLVSPVADVADSVTILNMTRLSDSVAYETTPIVFNNETKTFAAARVPPGRYKILATLRIPNKFNLSGEVLLDVGEDPVQNVLVTVTPSRQITGKISFEDSLSTVRGSLDKREILVALKAESAGPFLSTTGTVNPDGTFVVPDVAVLNYTVAVMGLTEDFYISSARMGGTDILQRGFQLNGDPSGPMEISISGLGGRIEGLIRTAQGESASAARVVLVPELPLRHRIDSFRVTSTDQYGRFSLRGVAPGSYKLFAWDEVPMGAYFDPDFLGLVEDKGRVVKVDKNDYIQIEVPLTQPPQ